MLLAVLLTPVAAAAGEDHASQLVRAQAHLQAAEYQDAARIAGTVARDATAARPVRAEAWRLYGLALFHLGLAQEAEGAFLEYLKLEPDAHLDPALHAPEAVLFLEDVRARHAGELAKYRPRPSRTRYAALNLLPPWGQFQNQQPIKGWAVGITEFLLLATNVTTYAILRSRCSTTDGTCGDDPEAARTLRTVNLVSGALLVGVVIYGVVDGYLVYRRLRREESPYQVGVAPTSGGAIVVFSWGF